MDDFYSAAAQLPQSVSEALAAVNPQTASLVTEIRLRSGRAIQLSTPTENLYVTAQGNTALTPPQNYIATSHKAMEDCFYTLCRFSVHAYENSIKNGFITLQGGHRAGIAGTAVYAENGKLSTIKNITSINIRIARSNLLTLDAALVALMENCTGGVLLVGPPASGKTTVLRGIAKTLSDKGKKIAVIDERFELMPVETNGFCCSIPLHTDVLSGYPKHIAMEHALRGLSPDLMICDEIGGEDDAKGLLAAVNAGVITIASVHAKSVEDACLRPQIKMILSTHAFTHAVILQGRNTPGKIKEIIPLYDMA
ncbi:MAG: ATPase, T2SS/T4P/T4SS family [Oscillospiraceae bacterium]|nr:ATPase, T2SS/T4P/T4SS family [Oscillospiraceae bacterium]